jgi:tetratricopeptide (TPR) repeat protein
MSEPSLPEESIFAQALEIESAAERVAFLDRACGNNPALRAGVESLLRASERSGDLLDLPEGPAVTTDLPATEGPGTVIGPYKLLEQIGEGGMGTVWMAEQTEPIQRRVAVKVVKEGMGSRHVLARFEAERQALAMMDHPNIAKVFDAGRAPSGPPYFVMELVKGQPITKYCDDKRLEVRERLELFGDICRAVQHAHQKGIIHRDLKPSNVLVAPYDSKPVVKVIDFGVAKATGQRLTDRTLFTGFGALVGTPEYMSPEQAEVNNQDIDTRSDIYSLGVLLYELLTGSTPLTRKRLKEAPILEVLRVIREEEPPLPSTRLAESKDTLPSISAQRQTEPAKLTKLVRGELDWIVMKALEKDRNRRYETANGLALDVQRYLADEPVLACPPSAWYRLRKLARRNRGRLAAAAVLGVAVVVAAGSIGWTALDRAARQARAANQLELALDRAELFQGQGKRPEALAALEQAHLLASEAAALPAQHERLATLEERLAAAECDQGFITRFEDIRLRVESQVNVQESRFTNERAFPEVRDALEHYGIKIGARAPAEAAAIIQGRPEPVRAILVAALDRCLRLAPQGDKQARQWLLATLDAADSDAWRVRVRRAALDGDRKALEALARDADVASQPPSFLLFLAESLAWGGPVESLQLELLQRAQRAHPADLWANHDLGQRLTASGRPAEAVRYFTAAIALRPGNVGTCVNRGKAFFEAGEVDAAIADFSQAVALAPSYFMAHYNLGNALRAKGKVEEAIACYQKAISLNPKFTSAHKNLDDAMLSLGNSLYDQGKMDEAIAWYQKLLAMSPKHAIAHYNLGNAMRGKGQLDDAIAWYTRAIALDPNYAQAHNNLASALYQQGKLDEAVAEYRKATAIDPKLTQAHTGLNDLGLALLEQRKLDSAIGCFRQAIALNPRFAQAHVHLGMTLKEKGKLDEAIACYHKAIAIAPNLAEAHYNLGNALYLKGRRKEAIAACREAIRLKVRFPEIAHFVLGNALRDNGQLDEAITELREAIRLKKDFAEAHTNLGAALQTKGQLDEAIAELREAIRLKKDDACAHNNLGAALQQKGRLDEAIAELREAIRLKEDDAEAHCNLGTALAHKGELRQALQEYRRSHELGSRSANWRYPSAQWVRRCERLVELDEKLPGILEGKTTAASPGERIELAEICTLKHLNRAAVRFYEEAFSAAPKLANDLGALHRYSAACAAALAGCGQGRDTDKLDDQERARLRRQALEWLQAELQEWGRLLDKGPDKGPPVIIQQLRHWLDNTDFAGVRGRKALAKLPEPERGPWQQLWDDVAKTLARAQARPTLEKKSGAK